MRNQTERITDKVFMQSIVTSFIAIVLCIVVLCSASWAWFNDGSASSSNQIRSGNCTVSVVISADGTEIANLTNETQTVTFQSGKTYQIQITSTGTASSSYCKLKVGDTTYYTEQISTAAPKNTCAFTLSFTQNTEAELATGWGTAARENRDFSNGKTYVDCQPSSSV